MAMTHCVIRGLTQRAIDRRQLDVPVEEVIDSGPGQQRRFGLFLRRCRHVRQKFLCCSDLWTVTVSILPKCQKFLIALLGHLLIADCLRRLSDSKYCLGAAWRAFESFQELFEGIGGTMQRHQQRTEELMGGNNWIRRLREGVNPVFYRNGLL